MRGRSDGRFCDETNLGEVAAMIKTILVPTSGSPTDHTVFDTALAVARPVNGHLRFLHLHLTPATAAVEVPHYEFCRGAAISSTLERLRQQGQQLAERAREHVHAYCAEHHLRLRDVPDSAEGVTASWTEERFMHLAQLLVHARHSDLTVLGRRHYKDHLPQGLIQDVLIGSGRPIVIASDHPPRALATIVVGWKEAREAARALSAALPLLSQAQRIVLLGVAEEGSPSKEAYGDLARQLAWHGVNADVSVVGEGSCPAATLLPEAAAGLGADLLVVGSFGRTPLREALFGGVTRSLILDAPIPIFMVH